MTRKKKANSRSRQRKSLAKSPRAIGRSPETGEIVLAAQEVQRIEQYFHGPIPPPVMLAQYEATIPGAANRILKMAEERHRSATEQGEHRRELEQKVVSSNIKREATGQWIAASIAISFGAASVYLAMNGQNIVASVIGGGTLVSLVAVFVTGKIANSKSLKNKRTVGSAN